MTRYSLLQNFLAFLFVLCLVSLSFPKSSLAAEVGIKVSPNIIEVHPQKDGIVTQTISVENTGKDSVDLDIVIKSFIGEEAGRIAYPEDANVSEDIKSFITHDVRMLDEANPITFISLTPGQKKKLTLELTLNNLQDISEYTFSVLLISRNRTDSTPVEQNESPIEASLGIRIGLGTHVLVAGKKDADQAGISIENFVTERFVDKGPIFFIVATKNSGSKYKKVYGSILITNMFGQQIGVIRIPQQILLSGTTKQLSGHIDEKDISKGIQWNEKLLLGSYTARLSIATTDTNQEQTKAISFFAFPIKLILLLVLGLCIGIFLASQIKKRL